MKRTYSIETTKLMGKQISLSGWVDTIRDHGQLLFVDLRDYKGKVQVIADPEKKKAFESAKKLGREFVIQVEGTVRDRTPEMVNPTIPTGKIEVLADKIEILNISKPLPFPIDTDGREINETSRLKYRFVDLRRERLQKILKQKSDLLLAIRNWMAERDFTEVITPLLTSTSPEGARDYVVPSRLHPGKFFVLPQAPQIYKQLLMIGGIDKYFQIAPCARDEDPRADRHAGVFYQIDMEMSFPTVEEIFSTCENLLNDTYKVVAPEKKIKQLPFPRIPYKEAMEKYGSDKPDIRFGLELQTITEVVKNKTEFNIFNNAEIVKCIVVTGAGDMSRTEILEMEDFAKQLGAQGLAYAKITDSGFETGIGKFLQPVSSELFKKTGAKAGDLLFFGADSPQLVNKVLGAVRTELGKRLNLTNPNELAFVWITDFPFYEISEETGKLDFGHNPFSMPRGGLKAFEVDNPLTIETNQYDLAINGYEILSGSIRNHDPEILVKAFETVGYGREEVIKRFGALYNAFQYGAPPHGGWAIGIDRLFMVLIDEPNIRDTYAFPKNSNRVDLMMDAPSQVKEEDLKILGIDLRPEVKAKIRE